jgi:hypothetical protein
VNQILEFCGSWNKRKSSINPEMHMQSSVA